MDLYSEEVLGFKHGSRYKFAPIPDRSTIPYSPASPDMSPLPDTRDANPPAQRSVVTISKKCSLGLESVVKSVVFIMKV